MHDPSQVQERMNQSWSFNQSPVGHDALSQSMHPAPWMNMLGNNAMGNMSLITNVPEASGTSKQVYMTLAQLYFPCNKEFRIVSLHIYLKPWRASPSQCGQYCVKLWLRGRPLSGSLEVIELFREFTKPCIHYSLSADTVFLSLSPPPPTQAVAPSLRHLWQWLASFLSGLDYSCWQGC